MDAADHLVLLPGMNCSARLWHGALRAAAPHVRGAETVHAPLCEPTLDRCVERLADTLPRRFALAGLSLGAVVAMAVVRRLPERVSGLALLAVNPRAPVPSQRRAWSAQRQALAEGRTARQLQQDLLPMLLAPVSRTAELEEQVLLMADETGEADLDAQLRLQASRIDERPGLSAVRVPTTVISAELDALCGPDRHEDVAERVSGSRLVRLPRVGHLAPLEAPDEVGRALGSWWRSTRP